MRRNGEGSTGKRRRLTRSRGGCFTCKRRKVKCDEKRPECERCEKDERDCLGFPSNSPSSTPAVQRNQSDTIVNDADVTTAESINQFDNSIDANQSAQCNPFDPIDNNLVASIEEDACQLHDWLHLIYDNSDILMPLNVNSGSNLLNNGNVSIMNELNPSQLVGVSGQIINDGLDIPISQLRSLCTSDLQFDALCRFFDFVAQCFHLLPSSQNCWRKVFAQLCIDSALVLKLTSAVGLVSLTLCGTIQKRPLAYALFAQSLKKWQELIKAAKKDNLYLLTDQSILEILAGAILIGHFEQFDVGLANHTTQCMNEVNLILHAIFSNKIVGQLKTDKGSHFRFLVKTYLWWDTLSRTLTDHKDAKDLQLIFDVVHQWEAEEEVDDKDVIQSCQCITGWPLTLLEVVGKIRQKTREKQLEQWQVQSLEAEILTCRPRVVPNDDMRVAELRFVIFEMLAAGVLIFFHRLVYGHCEKVQMEMKKVVHFLGKREIDRLQPAISSSKKRQGSSWIERAPDGNLAWAYLQASMALKDKVLQSQCERSLNGWIAFNDCAALNIELILLKEMWSRMDQHADLNECYKQICQERRWFRPLVF